MVLKVMFLYVIRTCISVEVVLCKAVWLLKLFSLIVNMSRGNLLHVWSVL